MKKLLLLLLLISPMLSYGEIIPADGMTLDVNTLCLGDSANWVATADSGSSMFYLFSVDGIQNDNPSFVDIPTLTMDPYSGDVPSRTYSGTLNATGTYSLGFYVDTSGGHYEYFDLTVSDCGGPGPTPSDTGDFEMLDLFLITIGQGALAGLVIAFLANTFRR